MSHDKRLMVEYPPKESRTKRKSSWLVYIFACVIFELVQESIVSHTGWLLWNILPKGALFVFGFLSVVCDGLLSIISDTKRNAFFKAIIRPDDMTYWEHSINLTKKVFIRYIRHNTLIFIVLVFMVFLSVPSYAASKGTARWVFDKAQKLMDYVIPPTDQDEDDDENTAPDLTGPDPKQDSSQPPLEESASSEEPKINTPEDNASQETAKRSVLELPRQLVLSDEMKYTISREQLNEVFFLDGNFSIEDWHDKQEVESTVRKFVQNQKMMRRNPSFDAKTSQSLLDIVSIASQFERDLLYDDIATAEKLCCAIDLRTNLYKSCPVYVLTTLTRENFCCYGDAYRLQDNSKDAAVILYGHSILWGFRSLQYEVDENSFKTDLQKLEERYSKLVKVLDPQNEEYQYALMLAEAFEVLANEL